MAQEEHGIKGYRHFEIIPHEPDELLPDFLAAGQPIGISQNGTTCFSGIVPGWITGSGPPRP